jgi:hypothetical protein
VEDRKANNPPQDVTIERLVRDLTPISRVWSPSTRFSAWLGLELVMIGVATARLGFRADAVEQLARLPFLLEVGLLGLAGALLGWLALLAAVPGRGPRRTLVAAGILLALASAGVMAMETPVAAPDRYDSLRTGIPCTISIVALASVPWLALLLAQRRAATLAPSLAGGLAGLAAFSLAAALFRLVCPRNELSHLLIWHLGPVALALVVSTTIGRRWLGRWRLISPK